MNPDFDSMRFAKLFAVVAAVAALACIPWWLNARSEDARTEERWQRNSRELREWEEYNSKKRWIEIDLEAANMELEASRTYYRATFSDVAKQKLDLAQRRVDLLHIDLRELSAKRGVTDPEELRQIERRYDAQREDLRAGLR